MRNTNNILNKEIIEKIKELTKDIKERVSYLRRDIDEIINGKSKSHKQIEGILDELLDYSLHGIGKREFKRLNRYYEGIDKKGSQAYDSYYKEQNK